MIVRLGLIVAASLAAFTVKQLNVRSSKPENEEGTEEDHVTRVTNALQDQEREEEEEKEEVKLISSIINRANDFEEDILPEFEDLLSGVIEFPLPPDKAEKDKVYEIEMANNASELERLRRLVQELEEREVKLEGELLEYYGLKEQESDIVELQRQLKIKTVEIDMLNITINSLQAERKKLLEELTQGGSSKRELEVARNKIKELQRQIQLEASQTKSQLLLLKQQVSGLQVKEEEAARKDAQLEKKLKAVNDLEVAVVELKRQNKELQHEKRELMVKLNAAESRAAELSNMTESDMVAKAKEEVSNLRHANEDLLKQVEGLQMNRFSEVEELVYLRWVNACLRYELRNYQTPQGKLSARDLSKSLSPKSQEKAKQLMLEYAGSERGQGDTDLDSNFSHPSSPGSEDFDNASIDSSTSKYSSLSKKTSLIQKFKKWGKSKDDSSALSSPSRSFSGENEEGTEEDHVTRVTNALQDQEVKADVETQGDFVNSLAAEVRAASFSDINDLVAFVNWLDEELSFLHTHPRFLLLPPKRLQNWPEGKADALREAAFEYQDLMKLENKVSTFIDDPQLPCEAALKKMYSLLEKVEQSVYALLRTRDMAISRYREFGIPVNWLLDSGVVGKIKLSSVQLAKKYMKRVASELDALSGPEKEPAREFLILQGVRFAFRVHQVILGHFFHLLELNTCIILPSTFEVITH
uniref:Protein CHUP1, chloroplastic n=1 Tax=Cajanus cajan TaxID=3821 RepID=A0A151S1U7_CAJCA|nr:hypothetical protein KK1_029561 [Cajanus cajan]